MAIAFVWGLVLGWWQATSHQPTAVDLVVHLGALPLALIGGYFLLRGLIYHLQAPRPVASPAGAAILDKAPKNPPPRAGTPTAVFPHHQSGHPAPWRADVCCHR